MFHPYHFKGINMKTRLAIFTMALVSTTFSTTPFADIENGKALQQEKCISCHMLGGDHTSLYQSKDRKVKDKAKLSGMVSMCTQNLNIEWFPDDEKDVVEYLNKQYYHFK